jgi:flagella basal body P-ring formation protein FlgA
MLGNFLLALTSCFPVEGDRILIGDLAAAIPAFAQVDPSRSIGFAPDPGAQRRFSAAELSILAARNGLADAAREPVCFERKLEALTKERILAALRETLPPAAGLDLVDFSQLRIPVGVLEFPRSGLARARAASPREEVIWKGRVKYSAARSLPVWAKVRAWISRPELVAVEDLPVGRPIGASRIRRQDVDAGPFAEGPSEPIENVAGMAPKRPIRAGEVIRLAALEPPADVTRGEIVGIEARFGAGLLKSEVRAEASGRTGDQVAVRNPDSGKIFRARVLRKGWVAVEEIQ